MLKLLLGASGSGKTTLLYQRIRARAEARGRSILLVPVTLGETGVPASWVGRVTRWWLGRHPQPPAEVLPATTVLRALPGCGAALAAGIGSARRAEHGDRSPPGQGAPPPARPARPDRRAPDRPPTH